MSIMKCIVAASFILFALISPTLAESISSSNSSGITLRYRNAHVPLQARQANFYVDIGNPASNYGGFGISNTGITLGQFEEVSGAIGNLIEDFIGVGYYNEPYSTYISDLGNDLVFCQSQNGGTNSAGVYSAMQQAYDQGSNFYQVLGQNIAVYMVNNEATAVCVQIWAGDIGWLGNGVVAITSNPQVMVGFLQYC